MDKIRKSIVKLIVDNIEIDWELPYNIIGTNLASGTGFFIDTKGHIVTCSHVVCNSQNILVEIPFIGSEKYECDVLGICPCLDIALLKIKKYKPKHFLKLGDMKDVKIGEQVLTIGYPMNYDDQSFIRTNNLKVTKGIVSGHQFGLYQTDSAINPGNSGGPMIVNNKVIGINSSGIDESQNIGYSVPIDYFKLLKKELMKGKRNIVYSIKKPFLFNQTNKNLLKLYNTNCTNGIYISNVFPNSTFEKAGLKEGHILCKIDKYKLDNNGKVNKFWFGNKIDINTLFFNYKIGQNVNIEYWTGKKLVKKKVELESYKFPIRELFPQYEEIEYEIIGGLVLTNLCSNLITFSENFQSLMQYALIHNRLKSKVIITNIFPNSTLSELQTFDISNFIIKINNICVSNIKEVKKALTKPIIKKNKTYFIFENSQNKIFTIELKDMLAQDVKLSSIYGFKLSETYNHFMKNK